MDSIEQLQLIRNARGDPALLALATVDLTFPDISDAERTALRSALEAAAVPHWCDTTILTELADDSGSLSPDQWARLKAVPVIEPFPARGADAGNVHEASRLAIRKRLAQQQRKRFIDFSARSARVFEADMRPIGRIEWIYHLLVVDPERGAVELEDLCRTWLATARHEDLAALSATLTELDSSQMLRGKPLVRARIVVSQCRADLTDAASLGDVANQLLQEAEATDDARLTGDAYSLVGDVERARGDLSAAERAFAQNLAISERLAGVDPANTGWQQDLAIAYRSVGDVAQARGDLSAAEGAFAQYLAIFERLTGLDPTNTGWQQDLAIAYRSVGDVAQARGDLSAAEQASAQSLAIFERLAALDPTNSDWQRELAKAHARLGDAAQAQGDLSVRVRDTLMDDQTSTSPEYQQKNDEQPSKNRFAIVAGDPLAGVLGIPSEQAGQGQAYQSWRETVQASGATAFVGGSNGHLSINAPPGVYERRGRAPGPVRREVIDELTSKYAPVPGYENLITQLSTTRLLVLRGAPGTGRATTGLRLLIQLTDNLARLSPDTDIRALTAADLEPHSGYLQELNPGSTITPPTADQVDLLRDYLSERECYLVLIMPHDIRYRDSFDGCAVDCPMPDTEDVFRRAIEYEIGRQPAQEQVLRRMAAETQPDRATGPQTPAEVQWLVAHLLSTGATKRSADDLDLLYSKLAARYVSAWFEPLAWLPVTAAGDEPVRLCAFRIALAVLNGSPVNVVAEVAEELASRIIKARSPRRMPGRPVFARHREDYVANSRASVKAGSLRFADVTMPANVVAYDDARLPLAVLRQVWAAHNMRDPLLSWLEFLCDNPRPKVSMSAALTVGLLASWDFSYTYHERIHPWAKSKKPIRRRLAAVALTEASRSDEVRPAVRAVLDAWSESGKFRYRWTAAVALGYGYDPGLLEPEKALKELRKLGCWEDGKLYRAAFTAVARLFVLGGVEPVIKTLADWLDDDRRDVRFLGLNAVYLLAYMRVSQAEDFGLTATSSSALWIRLANRPRWPLLVALADDDPALLNPLTDLVWQLTRSAWAREASAHALKRWVHAGKKDPACIGPVGRFLALIGDDHSDRARLLHLVGSLRRDRDEPLPAAIADRLERAIEYNVHLVDEKKQLVDEKR